MADGSKIEWTDATWNPVTGCTLVSEGCRICYAARLAATRLKHHPSRKGLARINAAGEAKFTGEVRFNEQWLDQPLRWREPRRVFVVAHGDLFYENVPDDWIDRVFAVMALAPQHQFQVLTKRPERMREYLGDERRTVIYGWLAGRGSLQPPTGLGADARLVAQRMDRLYKAGWPLPNVWLGVSVEDQAAADSRIPPLLATPAAKRFISAEPLLGPVDLTSAPATGRAGWLKPLSGDHQLSPAHADHHGPRLDWVIAGGESGPGARPMHPDWPRALRDQCAAAGVPFFFKQWGSHAPASVVLPGDHLDEDADVMLPASKKAAGATLDGREHREFPA